jgi:hypothetical protein
VGRRMGRGEFAYRETRFFFFLCYNNKTAKREKETRKLDDFHLLGVLY